MTYSISTNDSEGTRAAAERLSKLLKGGEVIELMSDLGGGKTTFVQGLAHGLGYKGEVSSPTFTISRVYRLPESKQRGGHELELHHYDLYRLGYPGAVGDELAEDIVDPNVITAIEWPGIFEDELPKDRLQIKFEVTGDSARKLIVTATGPRSKHLAEELSS
jgi:tRNA threonylcarbamoyladenosine biosynthesis protein TsaE